MDRSAHITQPAEDIAPETVRGVEVYGPDHILIGTISHLQGAGLSTLFIIDVGAFLGTGVKPVALSATSLTFIQDKAGNRHAVTPLSENDLKSLPAHEI